MTAEYEKLHKGDNTQFKLKQVKEVFQVPQRLWHPAQVLEDDSFHGQDCRNFYKIKKQWLQLI